MEGLKAFYHNTNKMKLLFLVCTSKTYNNANIIIDRPDLTRKMSCLETWVPRVVEKGHEVIFYSGDSDVDYHDEQNHHLYLNVDDEYDYGIKISPQFEKIKAAAKWLLENKEFDYIYLITDSDYVNVHHLTEDILDKISQYDFLSNGSGGEGFFLSKKACEVLVNDPHVNTIKHSDNAIDNFFKVTLKDKYDLNISTIDSIGLNTIRSYILAEDCFLVHYCAGKRMYWADFILSQYSNGTPVKRKIVYNLPINSTVGQLVNSYQTANNSNTPLYYSFTTDKNGWEHCGGYIRSDTLSPFMFGKESIYNGVFIDYHLTPVYGSNLNTIVLEKIIPSIQQEGYLIFYYDKDPYGQYELLKEVLVKHNVSFKIESRLLEKANIEPELAEKSGLNFDKEYLIIYG